MPSGRRIVTFLLKSSSAPELPTSSGERTRITPVFASSRFIATEPIYSVRIGLGWRAVGVRSGDEMVRFWIGSHADYDSLVSRFRRNV